MPKSREDLKAQLLAQAEIAIDQLLSDERLSEQMTFSEIEAVVGISEADFAERALQEVLGMQEEPLLECEECGGRLQDKGKRKKRVLGLRGEVVIERRYYQCQDCGIGFFPLG